MYYVYILKCADDTLYTGITKDVDRRLEEHNNSLLGAKYTKARRPVCLMYSISKNNRSEAMKEEAKIKKLSKKEKIELIEKSNEN